MFSLKHWIILKIHSGKINRQGLRFSRNPFLSGKRILDAMLEDYQNMANRRTFHGLLLFLWKFLAEKATYANSSFIYMVGRKKNRTFTALRRFERHFLDSILLNPWWQKSVIWYGFEFFFSTFFLFIVLITNRISHVLLWLSSYKRLN